jgi:hypothetical protein
VIFQIGRTPILESHQRRLSELHLCKKIFPNFARVRSDSTAVTAILIPRPFIPLIAELGILFAHVNYIRKIPMEVQNHVSITIDLSHFAGQNP